MAGSVALFAAGTMLSASAGAAPTQTDWEAGAYRGAVDVVESNGANNQDSLKGVVFDDTNKNSVLDGNERGLNGVEVSNGRETAVADAKGGYELPTFENMTVSSPSRVDIRFRSKRTTSPNSSTITCPRDPRS